MTGESYWKAEAVVREVKKALTGKDDCIRKAFAAILAGGHILIEDAGRWQDDAGDCVFQSDGVRQQQSAVYAGCDAVGSARL